MALVTVADILAINDRVPRKITVEEWGAEVYVQAMCADDYAQHDKMTATEIACAGLCDAGGVPLGFTPAQVIDMARTRHAAAIDRIALEVLRLTKVVEDTQPAPQPVRSFGPQEWKSIENQLKAVADASNRRASNAHHGLHGTVREGDQACRSENTPVCA